jgi:cell division septum initiation protein DivIVA
VERDSAFDHETFDQETVARALLLAQRTADLVISEAEEAARTLREQAQADADRIVHEAETHAASVTEEARSAGEAAVADLERRRSSAERDLALLLERAKAESQRMLEDAEMKAAALIAETYAAAEATVADLEEKRSNLELTLAALHARAVQHRDGLREMLSAQLLAVDGWLAANTEPEMATEETASARTS